MVPKSGDVLEWGGRWRWRLTSNLELTDCYNGDPYRYAATAVHIPDGRVQTVYFEELDITPENSMWRFIEDPFIVFAKEVRRAAGVE